MRKLYSSFDTVPQSGVYNVFAADGTPVGAVCVAKGDVLPPSVSASDYFELNLEQA